jgi:hypothetical protein
MLTTHSFYPNLVELGKEQQKNIHTGMLFFLLALSLLLVSDMP